MKNSNILTFKTLLIEDYIFKEYVKLKHKIDEYDDYEYEKNIDLEKLKLEHNLDLYYYKFLIDSLDNTTKNNFIILFKKFIKDNNNSNETFCLDKCYKNIYEALCYIYMVQYFFL